MPKIIPDLGKRILESAARHFETKGFEVTDMKSIASDLGISVGTLYNYYPSKPELFVAVSLLWKERLSVRMLEKLDGSGTPAEKLHAALVMLYEDMDSFTGIWTEFIRSGAPLTRDSALGRRFRNDNERLEIRLQALLDEVWKDRADAAPLLRGGTKLAQTIVGSILNLVMNSEDRAANREFVLRWIDFIAPSP